ncbi:MAG TPA: hypothetical protein VHT21_10640 [Stellaceae bacterium]|nr:hypothetical protein [Stellaceae bacterium]
MNIDIISKWLSAGASIAVTVAVITGIVGVIVATGRVLRREEIQRQGVHLERAGDRLRDHRGVAAENAVRVERDVEPPAAVLLDQRLRFARTVAQLAGGKALPDEVVAQIVERTDGVPLFVEELTKSVLESGFLHEKADRYVLNGALSPFAIPTTLHASLMARLDRLTSVRLVAQIGAAIGREFSYALLGAVSYLPDDELQSALGRLVASELVFQRGAPPDSVYAFKHALVQDAAHGRASCC